MPSSLPDPLGDVGTIPPHQPAAGVPSVTHDLERECGHLIAGEKVCGLPPLTDSDFCGRHHHQHTRRPTKDLLTFREHMVTSAQYDLLELSPLAGEAMRNVLEDDDTPAHVRVKAATELWDRIGIRGGIDLSVKTEVTVNPSEEIERRLDAMRAAMRNSDDLPPAAQDTIQGYVIQTNPDQLELLPSPESEAS